MKHKCLPYLNLFLLGFTLFSCTPMQRAANTGSKINTGVVITDPEVKGENLPSEQLYGPQAPDYVPPEVAGPPAPPAGSGQPLPPPVESAPAVAASQEHKLCLLLGPGMARAIAQAPILEAIKKAGIPVHCVVGTEMGAAVGALYALYGGNTNSLQWQLFKLNKENYFNFPLLSLRDPKSSGEKLHEFFRGIFRDKKIEELPIRFATLASEQDGDSPVNFDRGNIADALSATLAVPGVFEPWKVSGQALSTGAVSSPVPVELAKSLGGNFFVFIDVLDDAKAPGANNRFQKAFSPVRNLIRLQKRDVSFVIPVKAGHISFDEFSRQGEVLSIGARAAEQYVPQLKEAWEKLVAGQQ